MTGWLVQVRRERLSRALLPATSPDGHIGPVAGFAAANVAVSAAPTCRVPLRLAVSEVGPPGLEPGTKGL